MALESVAYTAPEKKGNFLSKLGPLGSVLGAIVGTGAGALTANPGAAAAGAFAGFKAGQAIGGAAGAGAELLAPGQTSSGGSDPNVATLSSADSASRRMGSDPRATVATLNQGMQALQGEPAHIQNTYAPILAQALNRVSPGGTT